jgi:Sugar (pentulose and hexulose) kinases
MNKKKILAFDYGASSGRGIIGEYDGTKIELKEVHRFSNDPVIVGETMYWDILRLFFEMKQGMVRAKLAGGFDSIAVDTWGVDFGLLDARGDLLENPVHYRDERTVGMIEKALEKIDKDTMYQITGIQFMELNTVFQLLALKSERPEILDRTDTLLLTPDLFNYFLTGKKQAEYSIASTTQMMDANSGDWSAELLELLDIPKEILPTIVSTGTIVGKIQASVCEELGLENVPEVIAVAGHDTQCAMASVPAKEDDFIFISCGTWSLFGTELERPIITADSYNLNLTNEGGYQNKTSFLKNILGLWLVQESRRQWQREGKEFGFGELETMASQVEGLTCFIDTDAPEFMPSGNIPKRIQEYCKKTGQYVPQTEGEIVRCINDSLALKYASTKGEIETCTGKGYTTIHMVGGGIQSKMLCQLTANACACDVMAGPIEATVYGNIVLQLLAMGEIKTMQEAREVIAASEPILTYKPQDQEDWLQAKKRYLSILKM